LRSGIVRLAGVRLGVVVPAAVVAALLAGVAVARPWADSKLRATISLATDKEGVVAERAVGMLFRSGENPKPTVSVEYDVGRWAGELVRLEVRGEVERRSGEGSTGYVACAAELVAGGEAKPLEFVGWQEGMRAGLHTYPIGPRAYTAKGGGRSGFAFATKGSLWHVFRAPPEGRVRLRLTSVSLADGNARPLPCVPSGEQRPRAIPAATSPPSGGRPDVFIYVIDALRADHLGCYGYDRGTSPMIDAFAEEATRYEQAHTAATWTRPSLAAMLTGLYPSVHGAMHTGERLGKWPVLLPEMLEEAGYVTRCLTANVSVMAKGGFDQGYEEFAYVPWATAEFLNEMARRRLEAEHPGEAVFMLVHTMEPHGPYTPRPESRRRFDRGFEGRCDGSTEALNSLTYLHPDLSEEDVAHLIDLYDAQVYEADQGFGEFLDTLRATGRYDNALIILVSDHGEAFLEHDTRGHGFDLNQETMRVALIVKYPRGRRAGIRVGGRVTLVDVVPSVLAEVGIDPELPYALAGEDLGRAAAGGSGGRRIYAEVARWDSNALDLAGVIDEDGYKRVIDVSVLPRETATRNSVGLWDTKSDPGEKRDLSAEMPVRAAYGEQLLARWLVQQSRWLERPVEEERLRVELSPEERRVLEALGYHGGRLGDGSGEASGSE